MNKILNIFISASIITFYSVNIAIAEIHKYIDDNGTLNFVDDANKVPVKYQNKIVSYDEDYPQESIKSPTKVNIIRNQILVPVMLHYRGRSVSATFLLDTGATSTTISKEIAEKLGIEYSSGRPIIGQVFGGGLLVGLMVKLDRMDVGPKSRADIDVSILGHDGSAVNFDGLLGMNFLRNYRYSINFDNHTIKWE
jgi:clan AA aspartic protease (TIGR02281 family)